MESKESPSCVYIIHRTLNGKAMTSMEFPAVEIADTSWLSWLTSDYISKYFKIFNTMQIEQCGRHLADDISKCIFANGQVWISIKFHWSLFLIGPGNGQ